MILQFIEFPFTSRSLLPGCDIVIKPPAVNICVTRVLRPPAAFASAGPSARVAGVPLLRVWRLSSRVGCALRRVDWADGALLPLLLPAVSRHTTTRPPHSLASIRSRLRPCNRIVPLSRHPPFLMSDPEVKRSAQEIEAAEQKADEYQGRPSRHTDAHTPADRSVLMLSRLCSCLRVRVSAETWLTMWTNTTNPKKVSCRTAFDIVAWCFGPVNQLRSIYRTGVPTVCTQQFDDFKLCIKVMAKSGGDQEEARVWTNGHRARRAPMEGHMAWGAWRAWLTCVVSLWCLQELLRADRLSKLDPRPHVLPLRTQPPLFFRRQQEMRLKAIEAAKAAEDAQQKQ